MSIETSSLPRVTVIDQARNQLLNSNMLNPKSEAERTNEEAKSEIDVPSVQKVAVPKPKSKKKRGAQYHKPSICPNHRPASLIFTTDVPSEYPNGFKPPSPPKFFYNLSSHNINCIKNAMRKAGARRTHSDDYNFLWAKTQPNSLYKLLNRFQRINHFPSMFELGRKDRMYKNISKQQRIFPHDYDFVPKTFVLPSEERFLRSYAIDNPGKCFIYKPAASACGRNIRVVKNIINKMPSKGVVSEYISNPKLINGYKFDLRIYVVMTSVLPLRVYIFENGLVRFATKKYSKAKLNSRYAHLTNFSINKKNSSFVSNDDGDMMSQEGSKWSLRALRKYWEDHGWDFNILWEDIKAVIIKTLISVQSSVANATRMVSQNTNMCFDLLGFDVLIDRNNKPWLIEVNTMPSLSSSSKLDKLIKTKLITDMYNLLWLVPYSRKALQREHEDIQHMRILGTSPPPESNSILEKRMKPQMLNKTEKQLILELEDEWNNLGGFEVLFPHPDTYHLFTRFFETHSHFNELIWKWVDARSKYNDIPNTLESILYRPVSSASTRSLSRCSSRSSSRLGSRESLDKVKKKPRPRTSQPGIPRRNRTTKVSMNLRSQSSLGNRTRSRIHDSIDSSENEDVEMNKSIISKTNNIQSTEDLLVSLTTNIRRKPPKRLTFTTKIHKSKC
ncbi:hypothetical protein PCE1_000113 [Barthelona sp. PCE]